MLVSGGATRTVRRRMRLSLRIAVALACAGPCACALASQKDEAVATSALPIMGGKPATAYPEAVVVTSSGFIPCSGVVLAPRVVLTAGHCRSATKSYAILAPNADGQTASGSSDWTTYTGDPAASSDTLLIFLDTPIRLTSYPVIGATEVAAGTSVVDVGRTLDGAITTDADYYSPPVAILGPGTPLGFPFNYEATPDISENGDSGGPIVVAGSSPHLVVAIVDTDTVEQNIDAGTSPIDLFARLDVVHDEILAEIASHEDAGTPLTDAGKSSAAPPHDAARAEDSAARPTPQPGRGSSCTLAPAPDARAIPVNSGVLAFPVLAFLRRRRAYAS